MLLILVSGSIYLYLHNSSTQSISEHGALLVDLNGIVIDQPLMNHPMRHWGHELFIESRHRLEANSLFNLVNSIRDAKNDKMITGIVLKLDNFISADQPALHYIGKALCEFRNSGKPIIAIGDNYSQEQYYLASYANKIYLSPEGSVDLHGLANNSLYYKALLDTLKVNAHVFRVGTYKSAVEPLLRNDMSSLAREADNRWINGLWQNYLNTVSANRKLTPQQVFPGPNNVLIGLQAVGGDAARYALNNKLVDRLASHAVVEEQLVKLFGCNKYSNHFNSISIYDYQTKPTKAYGDKIAVIFANGTIMDGIKSSSIVGSDTTTEELRQARLDPKIKVVILRINSSGGSVRATKVIYEELAAIRAAGKPIVVSMSGTAASGGYWISTPANYIIASPSTITGSIGIFAMINTYERTLDSLGVHTDGVETSPLASISPTKALPKTFSQIMQLSIEHEYKQFIDLVAKSRKIAPRQLEHVAQGHVWLGTDAKNNGLVDQLGDFDDAVKKAAELAHLTQWQLHWFGKTPSTTDILLSYFKSLIQRILPEAMQSILHISLPPLAMSITNQSGFFNNLSYPQNRYALCLTCGEVH